MSGTLTPFMPHVLREMLADTATDGHTAGDVHHLEGTCLFADVSGFTALSEKLASIGKEGSEELTRILNQFYDAMVDEILEWGGDIIKFAGDAMTVFFAGPAGLDNSRSCALSMQALMSRFRAMQTRGGEFSLGMKIGIARGHCIGSIVGDSRNADFLFAGPLVDQSAEAEHHASTGEIVYYDGTVYQHIVGEVKGVAPGERPAIDIPDAIAARFLHPGLLAKLDGEGRSFINEHRRVVILFVSFEREHLADPYRDIGWLQDFYVQALSLVRDYDGYINKIDMGDKGAKIIILFGAPVAHEDDPDRALNVALALRDRASDRGVVTRIGINYASIFAGIVGSSRRGEYTVMGDGVNLAARFMQAAGARSIVCSASLKDTTRRQYSWRDVAPISVKGKAKPQTIAILLDRGDDAPVSRPQSTFSGRRAEFDLIQAFVNRDDETHARALFVSGPQGIGKTALIAHMIERLGLSGVYIGTAHDYTRNTAYFPWKQILLDLLKKSGPTGQPIASRIQRILARESPQLSPFASILGNILGEEPLADHVRDMDDTTRQVILWRMIRLIIEKGDGRGRHVIVLDNEQWLDTLSRELLDNLLQSIEEGSPVFVVLGRNDLEFDIDPERLCTLRLEPFSREEVSDFALESLKAREVPIKVVDRLFEMSRGIPLIMQEILRSFVDKGYIERSPDYPDLLIVNDLALTGIPETLDALVMSRFDTLPPENRLFLRMVAVFGEEMPLSLVKPVLREAGYAVDEDSPVSMVSGFVTHHADWDVIQFVHPYFRTVIYESVDFATRRELHRKIADICLDALPHDYVYRNEILAYHYSMAENAAAAIPFLETVAKKSVRNHAYSTAIEQYERLIRFIEMTGDRSVYPAVLNLVELLSIIGTFDKANDIIAMERAEKPDGESLAWFTFYRARIAEEQGNFSEAIELYTAYIDKTNDELSKFRASLQIGTSFARQGDIQKAHDIFEQLLKTYRHHARTIEYGNANLNLGLAKLHLGSVEIALFHRALRLYRDKNHVSGVINALSNLGQVYYRQGKLEKARQHFASASTKASQFGYNHMIGMFISNVGYMDLLKLELEEARKNFEQALAYARKFKSGSTIYLALNNLAEVHCHQAGYEMARTCYAEVVQFAERTGLPPEDACIEFGIFLSMIGDWVTLEEITTKLETCVRDTPAHQATVAIDFFRAVTCNDREEATARLLACYQATRQTNPNIAFHAAKELFELASRTGKTIERQEYLGFMEGLRTEGISFFTIIVELCRLRTAGDAKRVKRIDRLFRKYPWPHQSWQRHLWIAEWYAGQGRTGPARKRIATARTEFAAILSCIGDERVRTCLARRFPAPLLEMHSLPQ